MPYKKEIIVKNNKINNIFDKRYSYRYNCYRHFSVEGFIYSISEEKPPSCSYWESGIHHTDCDMCKKLETYKPNKYYNNIDDIIKHYKETHNVMFENEIKQTMINTLFVSGKDTWKSHYPLKVKQLK